MMHCEEYQSQLLLYIASLSVARKYEVISAIIIFEHRLTMTTSGGTTIFHRRALVSTSGRKLE